jgi:lysylphosphatidylglycerol synthetase-like protein (DUF2156 family)
MSETRGGDGWWEASDGKWYPPHQATPPTAPPLAPEPSVADLPPPPAPPAPPAPPTGPPAPIGGGLTPPPPVPPALVPQGNGLATAAMVLGIVGIVLSLACGVGTIAAVLAIVFGFVGMSNARKLPGEPLLGRAKAGLILGIVAIVLNVIVVVGFVVLGLVGTAGDMDMDDGIVGINTDPPDGFCNSNRFLQDPDC